MTVWAWLDTHSRLHDWVVDIALPGQDAGPGFAASPGDAKFAGQVARFSPFGRRLVRSGVPSEPVPVRIVWRGGALKECRFLAFVEAQPGPYPPDVRRIAVNGVLAGALEFGVVGANALRAAQ